VETWTQFSLLLLAIMGFALRNEHRITLLEGAIKVEQVKREALKERVTKLEESIK